MPIKIIIKDYLKLLSKNNNRDWFAENKPLFKSENENFILFADAVLNEMKKYDNIETISGKKSVFRTYRDVRFSLDKTPYKTHFSGSFRRATKLLRGGYYFISNQTIRLLEADYGGQILRIYYESEKKLP